jgi:hypothetical protein
VITRYECETCGRVGIDPKDIEKCEQSHLDIAAVRRSFKKPAVVKFKFCGAHIDIGFCEGGVKVVGFKSRLGRQEVREMSITWDELGSMQRGYGL